MPSSGYFRVLHIQSLLLTLPGHGRNRQHSGSPHARMTHYNFVFIFPGATTLQSNRFFSTGLGREMVLFYTFGANATDILIEKSLL